MNTPINRRNFLGAAGALTVSVLMPGEKASAATVGLEQRPPLVPTKLASYISIRADGSAIAYFGKMDMGQGTDIGVAQMVAEELDLPADKVIILAGDTATSLNQGGASSASGVRQGGAALRNAAAEARLVMLELASKELGLPVEDLTVANGVISSKTDASKKTSYGELIGGRWFDTEVEWNGQIGNGLSMKTRAKLKDPKNYKVVGTPVPRRDVEWKLLGTADYVGDIKVPGMLHARTIMPTVAGAVPTAVDEASIKEIPGAKVVWEKNMLGVVAPREWDAIKASRQLKVTWSDVKAPFPEQKELYNHIRNAKVIKSGGTTKNVEPAALEEAFKGADKIIEATYEWPFHSHASMGPACAVVDFQPNGTTTVWTGSQKPHYTGIGVAKILGVKPESVHAIWVAGPGSYGRNDAGDAAVFAAIFSKATGKPVRYQGMRHEGSAWNPKAPASIHTVRAGVKDGKVVAFHFHSKSFDRLNVSSNESDPADNLGGQMLGHAAKPGLTYAPPENSYAFPVKQQTWDVVAPFLDSMSPLRSSHMRDPLGPETHFANEGFIDELAYALGQDPVAYRLATVTDARDKEVLKAASEKSGWQPHTAARKQVKGDIATGQGMAYAQRDGTRVAIVAEVDVNLKTGKVHARKFTVAHDCGLIVNPALLTKTIEGCVCMGLSRAMHEEVMFSKENVSSVDWMTYPILDITERPHEIDVVLVNRPDQPPAGAGEPALRPIAAAVANAIFDATGVRLRQAPFTPDRLKAGLA